MYLRKMDPSLHFRRPISEADDLAADFIENEIGRHDWVNNWKSWQKKHPDHKERIRGWLERLGEPHDPQDIIDAIGRMVILTPGKWK